MIDIFPLIIDCDTGRDDALALWLAPARGRALAGVVASYGNTTLDHAADNTARVLALAGGGDIPLLSGAAAPLRPHGGWDGIVLPRQAAAGNGLCDVILPSAGRAAAAQSPEELAAAILRFAAERGRLDYVIMGPATNFAAVCAVLGEKIHDAIARVTMMGGKLELLWETLPGADFNIAADPDAVRAVLASGVEVRFVPMDATWPVVMTLAEVEALSCDAASPVAGRAREIMIAHMRHFAPEPVFRFHDPAVMMALESPHLFQPARVTVGAADGAEPGRMRRTDDGAPAFIFTPDTTWREKTLAAMLAAWGLTRCADGGAGEMARCG